MNALPTFYGKKMTKYQRNNTKHHQNWFKDTKMSYICPYFVSAKMSF